MPVSPGLRGSGIGSSFKSETFRMVLRSLSGRPTGNLSDFMYVSASSNPFDKVSGQRGFAQLVQAPLYYPKKAGRDVIEENLEQLAKMLVGKIYISAGCGPIEAFIAKDAKILERAKELGTLPKVVIIVDQIKIQVDDVADYLNHKYPEITVIRCAESFQNLVPYFDKIRETYPDHPLVVAWFGINAGNFEHSPTVPNPHGVSHIRNVLQFLKPGSKDELWMDADCCTNPHQIRRAYGNPVAARWALNLFYRMRREGVDVHGSDFKFKQIYNHRSGVSRMGAQPKKPITLRIHNKVFVLRKHHYLHYWTSAKMSIGHTQAILKAAGSSPARPPVVNQNRTVGLHFVRKL